MTNEILKVFLKAPLTTNSMYRQPPSSPTKTEMILHKKYTGVHPIGQRKPLEYIDFPFFKGKRS